MLNAAIQRMNTGTTESAKGCKDLQETGHMIPGQHSAIRESGQHRTRAEQEKTTKEEKHRWSLHGEIGQLVRLKAFTSW